MPMRGRDRLEHRVAVSHVEAKGKNLLAISFDEVRDGVRISYCGNNLVATLKCTLRPQPAEAACRAGDQPDLAHRIALSCCA